MFSNVDYVMVKPADGGGEDTRVFFQSTLDPLFAVGRTFAQRRVAHGG